MLAEQPLSVYGDRTRLLQILGNVISNASKYTPIGGSIRIETQLQNDRAVIRVQDTGAGISPDLLPHVFDLFRQSERELDRSQGGLGIGLTIAKRLVEMHGGTIEASSPGLGLGSEFVVGLPLCPPDYGTDTVVAERRAEQAHRSILIIEDDDDVARSLLFLLESRGYSVTAAADGPAAFSLARELRPEIVLLDIGLPGMDGFAVARGLREIDACRKSKIIAYSGYGRAELMERGAASGIDHYLVKPIAVDTLLKVIEDEDSSA